MLKFKIPEIKFKKVKDTYETTNTIHPYIIRLIDSYYFVYYTDFSEPRRTNTPKEFKTLEDAQNWIVEVHYPAQIMKFLEKK